MKFLAILKDSVREALDGWVIYVMLGMSLILVLFVASFSVEPVPADEAFRDITRSFVTVYPQRGQGTFARPFMYGIEVKELTKTNDASAPQAGDYRFLLRFDNQGFSPPKRVSSPAPGGEPPVNEKKIESAPGTQFRQAVAYWSRPADFDQVRMNKDIDTAGVNDELVLEFVRDQFMTHGNMEIAKIVHRPPAPDGDEEFEVETKGLKGARGWPHNPSLFFGLWSFRMPLTLGMWVYMIESTLVSDIGATIALLVSIVITAFFIPNMMRKGSIDLLLSKPMHRVTLVIYKYIGGMTFVFINTSIAVGGVWLVIGLRTGVWGTGFLWSILAVTFYFAILYAVSTLAAVLTRNAIVAILATTFFWGTMFVVGFVHNRLEKVREDKTLEIPRSVYRVTDTVNAILPRTTDLDNLMNKWIVDDNLDPGERRLLGKDKYTYPHWGEVLGVSGLYIAVMLGLSCWRFSTRDY